MEPRINKIPKLKEPLEEDFDGDFLGGVMANHAFLQAKAQGLRQPVDDIPVIPRSTGENALETIGPDNFRGFPQSAVIYDASKPKA